MCSQRSLPDGTRTREKTLTCTLTFLEVVVMNSFLFFFKMAQKSKLGVREHREGVERHEEQEVDGKVIAASTWSVAYAVCPRNTKQVQGGVWVSLALTLSTAALTNRTTVLSCLPHCLSSLYKFSICQLFNVFCHVVMPLIPTCLRL